MLRIVLWVECLLFCAASVEGALDLAVQGESAILINGKTGRILYEKNAYEQRYPASITKIATAWLALEVASHRLDELVTVDKDMVSWVEVEAKKRSNYTLPAYWLEPRGTHIGLKVGEKIPLRDLFYGLLLASGNDAANAISKHLAGDIRQFMALLNKYLERLGCKNTHFTNPHGLFHPEHYTTAYDMALIAQAALRSADFRSIVKTTRYPRPRTELHEGGTMVQSNKLLRNGEYYYSYAIGLKTGYTQAAQHNLVAAAEKDGRLLIAVLLKSKERGDNFRDAIRMFNTAFEEQILEKVLVSKGEQPFTLGFPGGSRPIETYAEREVAITYYPTEEPVLKCELHWEVRGLPVAEGERVAVLAITSADGVVDHRVELRARHEVTENRWHAFKRLASTPWSLIQLVAGGVLVSFFAVGLSIRRKR